MIRVLLTGVMIAAVGVPVLVAQQPCLADLLGLPTAGDDEVRVLVVQACETPDDMGITFALARNGDAVVQVVAEGIRSAREHGRPARALLRTIARICPEDSGFAEEIRPLLDREDPLEVCAAMEALAALTSTCPRAVLSDLTPRITDSVEPRMWDIRAAPEASWRYGRSRDRLLRRVETAAVDDPDQLIRMVVSTRSADSRVAALVRAERLALVESRALAEALSGVLVQERDADWQRGRLDGRPADDFPSRAAESLLRAARRHHDDDWEQIALAVLAEVHEDPIVRAASIGSIDGASLRLDERLLRRGLADGDHRVVVETLKKLAAMGKRARPLAALIYPLIDSASPIVRSECCTTLGKVLLGQH